MILAVQELRKYFDLSSKGFLSKPRLLKAVDGVSFDLAKGETLGIVGESGCGKSTLGRTIMGLYKSDSGTVLFDQENITQANGPSLKKLRRRMQMVFQDPYSSLNPRMTVEQTLSEPLQIHNIVPPSDYGKYLADLLDTVGLSAKVLPRYPHEFSGGQRQRIGIARALSLKPDVIIADEPVSALDVSVQSQILNLLKDIQESFGVSFLFIAHDLAVVRHISQRVAVMYLGRIVELAPSMDLFERPFHPYTRALLDAVPRMDSNLQKKSRLKGEIPSATNIPSGCAFHPRCPYAQEKCKVETPQLNQNSSHTSRVVACHFPLKQYME